MLVPAGPVVLDIRGVPHARAVRLDGQALSVAHDSSGHSATVALSLERATGYHQLVVGAERRYLFGTEDAKLRIDGVVEMLAFLREHAESLGLAWSGTIQFSGSDQVLRDSRLDVAWLEAHAAEIEAIATSIAKRPFVVSRKRDERATKGVPDVAASGRLIRRMPELMEPHPRGPVTVDGVSWAPREFIRQRRFSTADTQGNRAVTRLVLATMELARASQANAPADTQDDLYAHVDAMARSIRLQPFAAIRRNRGHLRIGTRASLEERTDSRYRRARELLVELLRERHWDPRNQVSEEWAFAALADQVYQAFSAIAIAQAFKLHPVAQLGTTGPHFSSDEFQMWVDATPPSDVLRNWRDDSSTPTSLRPDITILRKSDGQIAIADAKYRAAGDRASRDSLSEVQLYLQSYGCLEVTVVFPPTATPWQTHRVTNDHFGITELPLRPSAELAGYLRDTVRPAIEQSFHNPLPISKVAIAEQRDEVRATAVQAAAVRTLVADGEVVRLTQPMAMNAAENGLRRQLDAVWETLDEDVQKMLITAEYFGDQVPEGFDHSGPVLGLFAACERLVRDRLFGPASSLMGGEFDRVTFGEAGRTLKRLPIWRSGSEKRLREWADQQQGTDVSGLGRCGKAMLKVNKWRIAAAHSVLVDKATWDNTHTIVLDKEHGLLVTLCAALPNPS